MTSRAGWLIGAILALVLPLHAGAIGKCLQGNCEDGTGTLELPGGLVYVGQFAGGKANGHGELTFPDGGRNSECVRDAVTCANDLRSMQSYAQPGAAFRGCFPAVTAYCYTGTGDLCFTQPGDCERSRGTIPGGPCSLRS